MPAIVAVVNSAGTFQGLLRISDLVLSFLTESLTVNHKVDRIVTDVWVQRLYEIMELNGRVSIDGADLRV